MVNTGKLLQYKKEGRLIKALSAWDYAIATILDDALIDIIVVDDRLGIDILGYKNRLPLTLDEILHHTKAVSRAVSQALVICQLPFLSYQESLEQAIHTAGRVLKETEANGVMIEGGYPVMAERISRLVQIGIPVLGHIIQKPMILKHYDASLSVLSQAIALEDAGVFALMLESVPDDIAAKVTDKLMIPTISFNSGNRCNGQFTSTFELLGLSDSNYSSINLHQNISQAILSYAQEVRLGQFPS